MKRTNKILALLSSSGSWWWTGKPGVLQSMGSQSVRHDWATELTDYYEYSFDLADPIKGSLEFILGTTWYIEERKKAEKTGIFSCLLPICEGTLGTISDKAMMQSPWQASAQLLLIQLQSVGPVMIRNQPRHRDTKWLFQGCTVIWIFSAQCFWFRSSCSETQSSNVSSHLA